MPKNKYTFSASATVHRWATKHCWRQLSPHQRLLLLAVPLLDRQGLSERLGLPATEAEGGAQRGAT